MKRVLLLALALLFVFSLTACKQHRTDVSREEIISAYEAAGYHVVSKLYDETLEHGQIGYVQADHPDGDYIYFVIFESEQAAKSYKKEFYHPGMMGLFSAIFGDPSWQRWEVYGCIAVQYDEPEFVEPFAELLEENES